MALNNDDIKQLIAILQRGLSSDVNDEYEQHNAQEHIDTKPKKRAIKTKKVKVDDISHSNEFDSMQEKHMHRDDIEIDKKLSTYAPTIRNRKFNKVHAVCRVCGQSEEVSPSLLHEGPSRYKCNKCARSPG